LAYYAHTANEMLGIVLVVGFITNTITYIALFHHRALRCYLRTTYSLSR
jgi:hypothetical protein